MNNQNIQPNQERDALMAELSRQKEVIEALTDTLAQIRSILMIEPGQNLIEEVKFLKQVADDAMGNNPPKS